MFLAYNTSRPLKVSISCVGGAAARKEKPGERRPVRAQGKEQLMREKKETLSLVFYRSKKKKKRLASLALTSRSPGVGGPDRGSNPFTAERKRKSDSPNKG